MTDFSRDRGLLLGDGLFETLAWRDGGFDDFDAHIDRLMRGCAVLGLPKPERAMLETAPRKSVEEAGLADSSAAVRLTWTAGAGGRGLDRPPRVRPHLLISTGPAPERGGEATLAIASGPRNEASPLSRIKSLAYLENVLARREARAAGADEALILNTRGEIACAAAANLFWFEGERLRTPALICGVLDGTVRARVLTAARELGIETAEVAAPLEALAAASGMFLSNSLIGLRRVTAVDGRSIPAHPAFDRLVASRPW